MQSLSFSQASCGPSVLQVRVVALMSTACPGGTSCSPPHPPSLTCGLPLPSALISQHGWLLRYHFLRSIAWKLCRVHFPSVLIPPTLHLSIISLESLIFALSPYPVHLTFNYWCSGSLMSHGYAEGQMVDTIPHLFYKSVLAKAGVQP